MSESLQQHTFESLTQRIADGEVLGPGLFTTLLNLGVAHWEKMIDSSDYRHKNMFSELFDVYSDALAGGAGSQANICIAEANYFVSIADELSNNGHHEQALLLLVRAYNWVKQINGLVHTTSNFDN